MVGLVASTRSEHVSSYYWWVSALTFLCCWLVVGS